MYLLTKTSASLYAGAIILETVIGWNIWISSVALIAATGLYTVTGGLAAVVYTEVLQAVVMLIGGFSVMFIGLSEVGWWNGLKQTLPSSYFHMFRPVTDPELPWTGLIFGVPINSIWYWCIDQVIVQRVLAAKSKQHANYGTIMAGYLKITPVFLMVVPGMIAKALYGNELESNDYAYPTLVMNILPHGLLGLMLAAMLSALMSSLASVYNSSATLFTMDIYAKFRPQASHTELVVVGKVSSGLLVGTAVLWIPVIQATNDSEQIFLYVNSIIAHLVPSIAVVFLVGIFWKRGNSAGAMSTLVFGTLTGIARFSLGIFIPEESITNPILQFLVHGNFMHFAILDVFLLFGVMVVVSLATTPEFEKMEWTYWNELNEGNDVSISLEGDIEDEEYPIMLESNEENDDILVINYFNDTRLNRMAIVLSIVLVIILVGLFIWVG
eukprot:TRINITY_DN599_c0_g1_i3.p1 TRINITY_DN599_c0_g1~~TRINITY_DN599_c0_g1_i3.p1  ORF type:complete len:440 (+),score=71.36 TRINITY_DN599_c0_g1_i3:530-1849(+)